MLTLIVPLETLVHSPSADTDSSVLVAIAQPTHGKMTTLHLSPYRTLARTNCCAIPSPRRRSKPNQDGTFYKQEKSGKTGAVAGAFEAKKQQWHSSEV